MRRLMMVGVVASVLLAGCSGVHLRRVDCDTSGGAAGFVQNYAALNGQTLRQLGSAGLTIAGTVLGQVGGADAGALASTSDSWLSFAVRPKAGIDYLGLGITFARSTLFAGGSIAGSLNKVCALACCEVVFDKPPSVSLDVGTAGVSVVVP